MDNFENNEFEEYNNPDHIYRPKNGFFYFNGSKEELRKMWEKMIQNQTPMDYLQEYMNFHDIDNPKKPEVSGKFGDKHQKKSQKPKPSKVVQFTHDEYLKLIEIRGYLAITEQFAHVKALDKVINHIKVDGKEIQ
jgi:hypothetical protein